jgi:transcriptional regulator with XRE-family HTH domain
MATKLAGREPVAKTWDAERVRALRRGLAIRQREFAELVGVSAGTVSRWERGYRTTHSHAYSLDRLEAEVQHMRLRVGEFISERLQRDPSGILSVSMAWQLYRDWCRITGYKALPYRLFNEAMADHGALEPPGEYGIYKGLRLPHPTPDPPQVLEPPPLGSGPDYAPVDGKLAAVPHSPSENEAKLQARLHARLRIKVASLAAALAHAGNQYAELMRAAEGYEVLLREPTDKLDVVGLWSIGGSLHELLGAYQSQADGTLAPPLEPQMVAALASVVRDHGAFVLGFDEGRALVERADQFALRPELISEIAKPGAELLEELASNGKLVEDKTRSVHATIRDTLDVTGWRASRTTYAGYLTVRNAFRAIIRFSVGRDLNAAVVAGGLIAASQLAGDPNCEFIRTAIPVLQHQAAQLLAFFKHSPEFHAYVQWALDTLERDRIARDDR